MCMPDNICKEYVLPDDIKIIGAWAHDKSASISFRPAGSASLKCLARGAGAKPHSILDKSIKIKTGKKLPDDDINRNEAVAAFFNDFSEEDRKVAENLLIGLVGHWKTFKVMVGKKEEKKYELDGIYLTTLGKDSFSNSGERVKTHEGMPYLALNKPEQKNELILFFKSLFKSPKEAEEECRKIAAQTEKAGQEEAQNNEGAGKAPIQYYLFTRLFFSGDYDAHDLMRDRSTVGTVTDESLLKGLKADLSKGRKEQLNNRFCQDKEKGLQAEVQEALDDSQKRQLIGQFGPGIVNCFGREAADEYCRVQHGPQSNYIAQMADENLAIFLEAIEDKKDDLDGLNVLVNKVMNMDLPVAMCDGLAKGNANWSILGDPGALRSFYSNLGKETKSTWRDQDGRDERIIHVFCSVIHYIFGVAGLRRDFDADEEKRTKVEKILSGYKDMYHDENKKVEGKTQYERYLIEALKRTFKA